MRTPLLMLLGLLGGCGGVVSGLPTKSMFAAEPTAESVDTSTPAPPEDSGPHHPEGYAAPEVHGIAAKVQEEACVSCHGETLEGVGEAASCDSCHEEGWRTDCTRCHGGDDNSTGAPPGGILGEDPFGVHTWHVTENRKMAYGCEQCHAMPEDVLSPGHLFVEDATPGVSEVDFSRGLSTGGTYLGGGTCTNLYCHGTGLEPSGEVHATSGPLSCDSCHPYRRSGWDAWSTMSGSHAFHIDYNQNCGHCHDNVDDRTESMLRPDLHVDGQIDRTSAHEMEITPDGCTGTCHEGNHNELAWE